MFFVLSKTLDLLVSPLVWAIALALFTSRKKRGHRRAWLAAVILFVFALEPVSNLLWRSLESSAKDTSKPDFTYDAVVLLGGVTDDAGMDAFDGAPPAYNDNVERLLTTFDLLRTNKARLAIITGGSGGIVQVSKHNEAHVLGDQLARWGIDRARIVLEDRARNTRENALFTKEILDARALRSVLLVTSAFHMKRAEGCFRALSVEVDTLPVDRRAYDPLRWDQRSGSLLPRAEFFFMSSAALREWVGRAVYGLRGYT